MADQVVFERLRAILAPFADRLAVKDEPGYYELALHPAPGIRPPERFVAAVRNGKSYVSFHLMPVYAFPDLAASASPALRKRMQGKSCFNFMKADDALFDELARLTDAGIERYRSGGLDGILGERERRKAERKATRG